MIVSDEQLEACCKAHYAMWFGETWSSLKDEAKKGRRECMRAALAVIPDPLTHEVIAWAKRAQRPRQPSEVGETHPVYASAARDVLAILGAHNWQETSRLVGPGAGAVVVEFRCRHCKQIRSVEAFPQSVNVADLLEVFGCLTASAGRLAPASFDGALLASKADRADVAVLTMDVTTLWNALRFLLQELQQLEPPGAEFGFGIAAQRTLARFEELSAAKAAAQEASGCP